MCIRIRLLHRNLKPLFGLCFDTLPLFGYHFKSYLFLWGLLGTTAYGLIAAIPKALSDAVFTFLLWAGMNSIVWNDIAIDGMTVQKMKHHKHVDTELQSYQMFIQAFTSIFMSLSSGFIIDAIGLQWLYAIICLIAGVATGACLMMDEKRDLTARLSFVSFWRDLKNAFSAFRDKVYLRIFSTCHPSLPPSLRPSVRLRLISRDVCFCLSTSWIDHMVYRADAFSIRSSSTFVYCSLLDDAAAYMGIVSFNFQLNSVMIYWYGYRHTSDIRTHASVIHIKRETK